MKNMSWSITPAHWSLARRYGKVPFRSPVTEELVELLSTIFSEEEAYLGSAFPVRPATSAVIAGRARLATEDADRILAGMDQRGVIGTFQVNGSCRYMLLPIVPGLFELVMWSRRSDQQIRRFAELAESYYNREYFTAKPKGIIKIIAVEKHIENHVGVLASDRVSELIDSHTKFSLTICCCRHSADLRGQPCTRPKEVCMAFGPLSEFLVARGLARRAEKAEMFETAQRAAEAGLVHLGDNVVQANFLCSCCACCCTGLKMITSFSYPWMIAKSHFVAHLEHESCVACGSCARRCPTGALSLEPGQAEPLTTFDDSRCIGCGVCVSACKSNHALSLVERPQYQRPHASFSQLAADCGLQSIGPMRTVAERFPGAFQQLRKVVEKGLVRSLR
jgi:ferredoxin